MWFKSHPRNHTKKSLKSLDIRGFFYVFPALFFSFYSSFKCLKNCKKPTFSQLLILLFLPISAK